MKIGLCGTVSVGKTTLVNALKELDIFKEYDVAVERSKYLKDQGIELNNDSTLKGQIIFAAERSLELLKSNIISDRTIYDVIAFTFSSHSISNEIKTSFLNLMINLKDEYDIIIYVSPEGVDIEDNGVRTTDSKYRIMIDNAIKQLLDMYPPKKLIKVKGSTEERISTIISNIN